MLVISNNVSIPDSEIQFTAVRSQGPGGQNVNKVSSAVVLRFDIHASSLPSFYKSRLLTLRDHRLTQQGVIVIKSQEYRSQDMNRQVAQERLVKMIQEATVVQKTRRATKPSRSSQKKRMDKKTRHGKTKSLRGKVDY
ncbi:alternative ribosome rescue aminoacyl-tRNA hydrolase ArfB [Agarilytica rhodophyticola]|uniref:alternative ribosome rescue aminoacyl-tRNA hydrolase ArfB n=1 Tax=Agarilytica rhodophyticola TaxID=1737490 RepID=UPI000B3447F4|nr:alternative ribosome rescue aminoacyl-tRNA hydrolase ArfB [Agarilytica rhodophyticola]